MQKNLLITQAYFFVNINFLNCQNFIIFDVCLIAICFLVVFWCTKIMRIQMWYWIQTFTPVNCILSEHQINLSSFLKSLTLLLLSSNDLALGTAYHGFLSWDVSLALENFCTSSILKNEQKRIQYARKVGWYS